MPQPSWSNHGVRECHVAKPARLSPTVELVTSKSKMHNLESLAAAPINSESLGTAQMSGIVIRADLVSGISNVLLGIISA